MAVAQSLKENNMGRPRKRLPLLDQVDVRSGQRIFERRAEATEVILEDEFGEPLIILPVEDISLGGLFIRCNIPMRVGAHALLRIVLSSESKPIRLVGEVVRVARDDPAGAPTGLGVRFVEVTPDIREALVRWIEAG
jgi:hypothetical protein